MSAIGFRAEKDAINWAVVDGTSESPRLVEYDRIPAPANATAASSLAYFRKRLLATLDQYKPDKAAVRFPELFGRRGGATASLDARIRVEGVILEALATAGIPVWAGAMKTISSHMGSAKAKEYLDRDEVRELAWPTKNPNGKEALLVAISALEASNG